MRWSVNPYRGCIHACAYCYARTSHQYLGFGAGSDFDRKIVVKMNAAERLREAFDRKSWTGDVITLSGNTDCYQPIEACYRLTRACLEVCLAYGNPAHIITKGSLIRRDVALLAELDRRAAVSVSVSVTFANDEMGRLIEPGASDAAARFETIRRLREGGVQVGVNVCPIIPGLNDRDVPEILERARDAGATSAFMSPVRLAAEVAPVFLERIESSLPLQAAKIRSAIAQIRRGKLNESRFGERMVGEGPRWEAIAALFAIQCKKLGLTSRRDEQARRREPSTFRRPSAQGELFGPTDATPTGDRS